MSGTFVSVGEKVAATPLVTIEPFFLSEAGASEPAAVSCDDGLCCNERLLAAALSFWGETAMQQAGPPHAEEALAEPALWRARAELHRPCLGMPSGKSSRIGMISKGCRPRLADPLNHLPGACVSVLVWPRQPLVTTCMGLQAKVGACNPSHRPSPILRRPYPGELPREQPWATPLA